MVEVDGSAGVLGGARMFGVSGQTDVSGGSFGTSSKVNKSSDAL